MKDMKFNRKTKKIRKERTLRQGGREDGYPITLFTKNRKGYLILYKIGFDYPLPF